MGLIESKPLPEIRNSLIPLKTPMVLPFCKVDLCKFKDGTFGFLLESYDLAHNLAVYQVLPKVVYSPSENIYSCIGTDSTHLLFVKDRFTKKVYCTIQHSSVHGTYECGSVYQPIGDPTIDALQTLFTHEVQSGDSVVSLETAV